ncbi:MAG: DUF177 domain-containing protein [Desulfovibrio sp.]|jgi:uncharacterized protein|nr:DUF177 domain-containing protein [Desulfovibrio sp.]
MRRHLILLSDIPGEGRTFILDDPAIWQGPLQDFAMDCRISRPLRARLTLLPADDGCLVRGRIDGEVILSCNRCAEDAVVAVNADFENFEEFPGRDDSALESENRILYENTTPMLDLNAICWEEFVLALPVAPLCSDDCKGLCAVCGANLNVENCSCRRDEGDPRFSVLRGVVLRKP